MNDYLIIKHKLEKTPYLIADGSSGSVRLATEAAALKALLEGAEFPSHCLMNVNEALKNFVRLRGIGEDREFNSRDIAKIAGMGNVLLWQWYKRGVLKPSIKDFNGKGMGEKHEAIFSWCDAFCAGVIGSLRRHGMRPGILKKVQPLLTETKPKKQTARKASTPERS